MLLRPTTTASAPAMGMPERTSSSMQPFGVHGMNCGVRPFITSWPIFIGWKPSTSLFRLIRSSTACSFSPLGSGNCTRMPLTTGSALSSRTNVSTSACVAVAGSRCVIEPIPASSHAFPLDATYVCEAGFSPTSTAARVGVSPVSAFSRAVSSAASRRTASAMALPSISFAGMRCSFAGSWETRDRDK